METDKRSISGVEIFSPSAQVNFHTDQGTFEIQQGQKDSFGVDDTLVACQTWKDISQPAGSFMIHLADYARYDKSISPMDLCTIKMSNHASDSLSRDSIDGGTMIGLVDSVRRKKLIDPNTGKPNVFCEIKGRDFGKLLVKHQTRYIPWLQSAAANGMLNPVISMFRYLLGGYASGGNIDFLMVYNLRHFFSESVDLSFKFDGSAINLSDALSYRAHKNMGIIPYNLPLMSQEGSLWQILQNYANIPFNELWVDTIQNPKNVITDLEASPASSPLDLDTLSQKRSDAVAYSSKQSGVDQAQSMEAFGASGEKIGLAQKWNSESDRCNAYTMVMFRRTPFDQDDWNVLPTKTITNADIMEQDLGTSDAETYNMFWVYPLLAVPGAVAMKGLGALPLVFTKTNQYDVAYDPAQAANKTARAIKVSLVNFANAGTASDEATIQRGIAQRNAVEKFGFLPLEVQTRVWRWADGGNMGNSIQAANGMTLALANWHKHNSILKSGSMTLKGDASTRVGSKLYNKDEDEEYYVEAVSNNYVRYRPFTTTVMVTRGQTPGAIQWGNAYKDFCQSRPLAAGAQGKGGNHT